jgi:hypothetical protein
MVEGVRCQRIKKNQYRRIKETTINKNADKRKYHSLLSAFLL